MYMVPQEGDRVQEIGQDPKHGVLISVQFDDRTYREYAEVWWDGDVDAHTIDFAYIEMEYPD